MDIIESMISLIENREYLKIKIKSIFSRKNKKVKN